MTAAINPELDLSIARVIKAPRAAVWRAWADPACFEQWWIPAPLTCRVVQMDLRPGGAFETRMSEDGRQFTPHLDACFLAVDDLERIVFTNALRGDWRPGEGAYPTVITAVITLRDHPEGTDYAAHVMHRNAADRQTHDEMGFQEGWGTVIAQLAARVERRA
jgi:uncharacterized protein YndB with AHSA1/START domain